jgi:FixJ family two-component response regulator
LLVYRSKSIAVVEDDTSLRDAMENLISSHGLNVYTFVSAESFLAQRDHIEIDCLITDVQMDGMGGVELFHVLLKIGVATPVIFITAFDDERIHKRVMAAGAKGYFRKPFESQAMIDCIDQALAM